MPDMYILVDGEPIQEPDLIKWAKWFNDAERSIAKDRIGDVVVSTVFLGLDHSFGDTGPILYETMVFGGALDQEQQRYGNHEGALSGHAYMVQRVKEAQNG